MDGSLQLSALADPTRRAVVDLLVRDGPQMVASLAEALPVSRPAVSQHLKVLVEAGLVTAAAEGNRRIYRVEPGGIAALRAWIDTHFESVLDHYEAAARRRTSAMTETHTIEPVTKARTVPLPVDAAFELFTRDLGSWWPTDSHAIGTDAAGAPDEVVDLRFEGRVGGRVVEITASGTEHSWADVLAWDPPHRFVLSWHPSAAPTAASRLEVRFRSVTAGTEVVLEHGGWEEFDQRGADLRQDYDAGWDHVLGRFVAAAE